VNFAEPKGGFSKSVRAWGPTSRPTPDTTQTLKNCIGNFVFFFPVSCRD